VANRFAPADVKSRAEALLKDIEPPAAAEKPTKVGDSSLLDQLSEEHDLLWQQAVKSYKDAEAKIRKAILDNDFAEAQRLMDFAKQTIELNKRYAPRPGCTKTIATRAKGLEQFIQEKKNEYDEWLIGQQFEDIKEAERRRLENIEESKQRRIEQLLEQASDLRKDQRLDDAIQVLKQVLIIDPKHSEANLQKDILEDLASHIRDKQAVGERHKQVQDLLVEADETGIPWHDDMIYPKNWPEITARRGGGVAEELDTPATTEARTKLKKKAPELTFDALPLEAVIEELRKLTGLNIVPNWNALEAVAIERDAEVTLNLKQEVSFEKAIELILDEIGAGDVDLGYVIDDGIVRISTKEDLSRKTVIRVYNVQDLLISVPTFRGRLNLDQMGQDQGNEGGLGGGRFIRGGGGGGGAAAAGPGRIPSAAAVEWVVAATRKAHPPTIRSSRSSS